MQRLFKLLLYINRLVKHMLSKSLAHNEALRLDSFCSCCIWNWNNVRIKMWETRSYIRVSALNSCTPSSASKRDILILLPNIYLGHGHPAHDGASVWSLWGTWRRIFLLIINLVISRIKEKLVSLRRTWVLKEFILRRLCQLLRFLPNYWLALSFYRKLLG